MSVPVLSRTRRRLLKRPPWPTIIIAVAAFALVTTVLGSTAPTRQGAQRAAQPSIASICQGTVNSLEASYREQAPPTVSGPVVHSASYRFTRQQVTALAAKRQDAIASCEAKGKVAQQAGWSYLSARMVEVAVDASITVMASTLICSYTGPAGCKWGVKIAAFTGGFFGALVFQYLTDGTVDWKSVGSAFFDATISMLTFSGLDKLQESYVRDGVRATFQNAGTAIQAVPARIGGLGSGFTTYVDSAARWIWNNLSSIAFGGVSQIGYTGGGSVVPAMAVIQGVTTASPVEFRDLGNSGDKSGSSVTSYDLHSGTPGGTEYDTWDIHMINGMVTNSDGAIGYTISQGSNCLTSTNNNGSSVWFVPCNSGDQSQWWFADGDELMSSNGFCINEVPNTGRWLTNCSGLNYLDSPSYKDDQFLMSPESGSYLPDTVANLTANWKIYAG